MREEQVIETLEKFEIGDIHDSLRWLEESGRMKKVEYRGKVFWLAVDGQKRA